VHFNPAGSYLPTGVALSGTVHRSGGWGGYAGAEASLVFVNQNFFWHGAYVDAGYDFANGKSRISLGPEFGWAYVGIDGGVLLQPQSHGWGKGFVVRPLITLSVVALYFRYGQVLSVQEDRFAEFGFLFKYPLHLSANE
jgi:hypothetical protein